MPQISSTFLAKILELLRFMQVQVFVFGSLNLDIEHNEQTLYVSTESEVIRVWFHITPTGNPYLDEHGQLHNVCYVSEAIPVPGGFEFRVLLNGPTHVHWFAIQG